MAEHFIVYAARRGARNFFDGVSDPTFFTTINKILDDGHYKQYKDPRHGETFRFESLRDFVVDREGLGIPDWLPFMKALKAQDEGSAAKALYWRMLEIDERLNPLPGAALALPGPEHFAKEGDNQHSLGCDVVTARSQGDGGNSAAYLAARLKKAGRDDLLKQIGPDKPFRSIRAAAIEAGIIKPIPSVQLKEPSATAQKVIAKKGKEWSVEFAQALLEQTA